MNITDHIASITQKKFELDCIEMALVRNTDIGPILYRGAGYIKQTLDDALIFKIYVSETENVEALSAFFDTVSRSGKLYTDGQYYTLSATTIDGTEWTAAKIIPSLSLLFPVSSKPIVSGEIRLLATDVSCGSSVNFIKLYFFEDVNIPYRSWKTDRTGSHTRTIDKFSALDMDFTLSKGRYWVFG